MKKKMKKLKNSKYFPFIIIGGTIFILILLLVIKSLITGATVGVYGNRLKGIKDVPVTKSVKSSVIENISSNDKTKNVSITIKGKIINIAFEVKGETTKDEAKKIAEDSLGKFSSKIKKFYDIQVFITKPGEEGKTEDVQKDDGTTKTQTVKDFPIIGYKNSNKDNLVW